MNAPLHASDLFETLLIRSSDGQGNASLSGEGESSQIVGEPPRATKVFSILLNMASIMIVTCCLYSRWPSRKSALGLPVVQWLNIVLYIDSLLFTAAQLVVRYAYGLNYSIQACRAAVMFCLSFYLSSKLIIYFYFVERSFMVWSERSETRRQNRLYMFNMTVIIGGYIVIIVFTFIYKIEYFSPSGYCVIGIQRRLSIPLVTYEMAINIYLTLLFLWPVRKIYSFKSRENTQLRHMTVRCLIGALVTCLSTGVNLTVITILDGEQAWLCLMLCNLDIIICVVTLHWVTSFGYNARRASLFEPPTSGTSPTPGPARSKLTLPRLTRTAHNSTSTSSWSDPVVTTSITHDHKLPYNGPSSPNNISVHTQHSQKIERLHPESDETVLLSMTRSSDHRRSGVTNWAVPEADEDDAAAMTSPQTTPAKDIRPAMTHAHLKELGIVPRSEETDTPAPLGRSPLSRRGSLLDDKSK